MATTTTNPASSTTSVEKTYKYFDLDTFKLVEEKKVISFTPAVDYAEALNRIGNDSAVIVKAINTLLQRQALNEARKEVATKGASKKIVLNAIKPFRAMPPYDAMERKEQTEALLELARNTPFMVAAIKAASLKALEADEDEDGNDDSEE